MRDDRLYLDQIRECIDRIEQYTREGKQSFLADTRTQDAVLRNLHILAESTQRLSVATKARYPATDWRSIAAFRNVVVHGYLGISLTQIWAIVENDLPNLKSETDRIIREWPGE